MAQRTSIEWCDTTWNPTRGCSRVSEGCRNCYAERMAARFSGPGLPYEGLARTTPSGPRWTGKVRVVPTMLDAPRRWRKPRCIFVNSMSDLFHEDLPDEAVRHVIDTMAACQRHTFIVLTKRPDRMLWFVNTRLSTYALANTGNIWWGVSVEDQATFDERVPRLLNVRSPNLFISAEPLLGPISMGTWGHYALLPTDAIRGLIVGGESGPGARPMDPEWVRDLRDERESRGLPFFFKQWGGRNKKATGRTLDGREHNDLPWKRSPGR